MHRLANRQKSFKGQKRIKGPGKSTVTVRWPHPDTFAATPETLAEAGFFWTPATGDEDAATCYKCQKEISDWTEEDDPFDIHFTKCAKSCSWAFLRCGLRTDVKDGRFVSTEKNRFPNSKAMENARLDTFVDWKHDRTKNSTCSSKKLAHAGFISGQLDDNDDDLAMCIYCDTSLTGWVDGDDPMEEHRTRSAKSKKSCPFIEFASATTLGRSTSRAKSKASDLLMPTKTFDGGDDLSDAASSRSTGKGGKAPRRGRSDASHIEEETTARPTRSRTASTARPASRAPSSRSKPKPIAETEEEAEEEEDEVPEIAPRAAPSKATRARAKSKAPESDENEAPPPPRTRKQSTRSKANKTSDTEDAKPLAKSRSKKVVLDEEDAPTVRTNASRSTKKALLSEDEQPEPPKKTKGKGKATALPPPDEDEEDEEERATLRKSTRAKPSVKAKAVPVSDDDEIETATSLRKSTRGKPKPKTPVSSDEEDEEPVPKKSTKGKKSKVAPPPASEEEDEPAPVLKKPGKSKKSQPADAAKASKANARPTKTHFASDDPSDDDLIIQSSPARLPAKVHPLLEESGSEPEMVVDEPASVPVKSQKTKEKAPPRKALKSQDKVAEGSSQGKNVGTSRSKQPSVGPKKGKKASTIQNADDDGDEVFMDAMDELPDDADMEVDTVKQSRSSKASPSSSLSSLPSSNPPSSSLTSLSSSRPPSTRPLVPSSSLSQMSTSSSQTSKPPSTAKKPVSGSDKTMELEVLSSEDERVVPKAKAQPKAKAKTKEPSFIPQPSDTKIKELERKKLQNNVGKLATKFEFPTKPASSTPQSRLFPPSTRSPSPPVRFRPSPPPRQPSPLSRPPPKREKTPAPAPKPVPPPAPPETPDVDMHERSFTPEPVLPPDDNDTIMFVATPPQKVTRPPSQTKPPSTAPPAPPTLSEAFIPILASEPFVPTTELTEEELNMSVEDWILSQMRRESRNFLADAQRQVARYDTRVMEVRRTIQAKLEESI
ncbi:hypothetical protein CYLTODRAFT_486035 [Cylindrobasidium torrendii FP15055 ss-10]|uniref:BIR-domain-containing protein n=1 Tax=Cylindrobasidium torrendii FP15055 ss-10 TaxID=1314674 RepID=A0A0D7BQV3_9AGAR|nr:hypothetical protein CYLTODRAFT_486035 [Cylindrobasidium torrendii FP15055 ss-10]